jgi:hypothetical protein
MVDILVIVCVLATAAVIVHHRRSAEAPESHAETTRRALTMLYERASYYGALENTIDATRTIWPVAVLPEWFERELPTNPLLPGVDGMDGRPWIDVAPPGDPSAHPPNPVAVESDQAQFWYNPNLGVFRARVPATLGEADALMLYNRLNGVTLDALARDTDPARMPLAYTPGRPPSATLASPATTDASTPSHGRFTPPATASPAHGPSLFRPDVVAHAEPVTPPAPRGRARLKDQPR